MPLPANEAIRKKNLQVMVRDEVHSAERAEIPEGG